MAPHGGERRGVLKRFDPASGAVTAGDILGATDGPIQFIARPGIVNLGAGVMNCPRNVRELQHLRDWDVRLKGTLISADAEAARRLVALADVSDGRIVPRSRAVANADFFDLWYVFDYGGNPAGQPPGRVAIRMRDALNTGGFRVTARPRDWTRWPFEFSAHVPAGEPDRAGFEVWLG